MEFATLASNAFGKHTPDNFMLTAILPRFPISVNVMRTMLTHPKDSGGLDVEGRSIGGERCSHDSSAVINTTHTRADQRQDEHRASYHISSNKGGGNPACCSL